MADAKRAEALVRAASNTNLAKVQELLAQGADPNEPGEFGRTPLPLAVRYAYNNEAVASQIAEVLLAAGAETTHRLVIASLRSDMPPSTSTRICCVS